MKGRIGADDTKTLTLKFSSKIESQIKGDIVVFIRGGRTLRLPFSVTTIIPNIQIVDDKFDFGNITTLGKVICVKIFLEFFFDSVCEIHCYLGNPG